MALEEAGVKLIAQGSTAFDADMKSATKAVDGFGAETKKSLELVQDSMGFWHDASKGVVHDAQKVAAGIETIVPATKDASAAVDRFGSEAKNAADDVDNVAPAAKKAGDAAKKAGEDAEKGGKGFDAFGEIVTGALRKVGEIAIEAFAQATKATVAFIGDSIEIAGDFDQKMSVLQATSGATAEEMEQLSAKAKELGADLTLPATSAVNAGDAMLELAKAGFTVTEQMDAAKGVLQLAAAAQIDEAKAAEINANALQAFGLAAKESMFVSDLLAASANASSINATDMADTYKMAGAIFSAFQGPAVGAKQSLIDLTTAAALLGNAGIKGSDAGTSLKQSLLQLTAPSDKAKGFMKMLAEDIGVTGDIAYDAQGKMRPFPEILDLVSRSTKGLTEENRNYLVSTIFGADAARAILILMQQGPEAWDKMTDAVTRQGAAQDLAAAQTKGLNGAIEGAKSQIETLQLTIGQALTPILAELLNTYISPGIASITKFADSFLKMVPAIMASDDPLQSFLNALKILVPNALDVISVIEDVKDTVADIVQWFNQAGSASDTLGGAIDDLSGIWTKANGVITNVLNAYMAIAEAVLPIVTAFIDEHGTEISAFFKSAWDSIIEIITLALDLYNAIVPPVLNAIAGFISDHGSEITKILSGVWDIISNLITVTLDTIKGVFKVALAVINGDWEGAWEGVKGIVDTQAKAISGVVTGFLDVIAGIFDTSMADIGRVWSDNWAMLVNIATKTDWAEVGQSVIDGILDGLRGAWSSLSGWLSDKMSGLVDDAMAAIGASSPAKEFMPVGEYSVLGIMEGFSSTWPQLINLVGSLSGDLIDEMKDIGRQMQDVIADSFGSTASINRQIARNIDSMKDVLPEYTQATSRALQEAQNQASDFIDPAEGARFFQMRSRQILEYAKLQSDLATEQQNAGDAAMAQAEEAAKLDELRAQLAVASTEKEIEAIMKQMDAANKAADANRLLRIEAQAAMERIAAQITLITQAQSAERSQFEAQKTNTSPALDIADQINAVMKAISGMNLTDDQIKIVDMLSGVWAGLQQPITSQQGLAPPQTRYHPTSGGSTSTNTTNVNMPIYTNNTAAALQQSWAVMQASMP